MPKNAHKLDALLQQAAHSFGSGDLLEAEQLYLSILQQQPHNAIAINELGRVLQSQNRLDQAAAQFRHLIELQPDLPLAHKNLGVVLCQSGKLEESFNAFQRHAALVYSATPAKDPPHKIKHAAEQRDHLRRKTDAFHLGDGSSVAGHAVNPAASDIAAQWKNSQPQILVIDNFLTDAALNKLRNYCQTSTIWRQAYADGYLGALPEHGLGSPLLAQIADEFRAAYTPIIGELPLRQFWGFVYDSGLSGIDIHADFAAVNVNFWLTPDDANTDPASGGMVIWDKPAPLDWDFTRYNDDPATSRDFLQQAGAEATIIPYRCNRMVIFNSNLFHKTDKIAFKPGFLNRRINITMLYGSR